MTLFVYIVKNVMKFANLTMELFVENRNKFSNSLKTKLLTIQKPNHFEIRCDNRILYYRQTTDFFNLSAIDKKKTIQLHCCYCPNLLYNEVLFLRQTNGHLRLCEGNKYTKSKITKAFAIKNGHRIKKQDAIRDIKSSQNYKQPI